MAPGSVVQFEGSLEALLTLIESTSGGIIDLQGSIVQSEKPGLQASESTTGPTDNPSDPGSPHSSDTVESLESRPSLESSPSELLTVAQAATSAAAAEKTAAVSSPLDGVHSAGLPPRSPLITPTGSNTDLSSFGPRALMRHATVHAHAATSRSKRLQQERKHASRSSPSNPISLASAYNSKELVSKALSRTSTDSPTPALVIKGQNVTIRNGTIHLPVNRVLMILKDQHVTFEEVAITGPGREWDGSTSFPLIHVEGARVHLSHVSVSCNQCGHGLTLGPASHVTMDHCVFEGNDLSGILVGCPDCYMKASHCAFNNNLQDGAIVCRGSTAEFDSCQFSENEMLGLEVAFGGARATLRGCTLEKNMDQGVSAYSTVSLVMERCEVKSSHRVGVSVLDDTTTVSLSETSVTDNRHEGILACQGVKVEASKCKLTGNRVGLEASGAGTTVTLHHCNLSRNANANITVNTAALVSLEQSECTDSRGKGVAVLHPGSRFTASHSVFARCATTGVHVSKISFAALEHCVLKENHISGAHVTDTGSVLNLEHCSLSSNQTIGVFANKAGDVTLKHCEISGNGSTGAEVRDRQARMRLAHCVVKDNRRVGVYCHSAAIATLVACVLSGNGVKAMLVGGRENVEMGGGIIEYDRTTDVDGEVMMRHSGRALIAEPGALTQSLSDVED